MIILDYFSSFHNITLLVYEQINPNSIFGKKMIENLKIRDIELVGIKNNTLEWETIMIQLNMKSITVKTMHQVYDELEESERKRIARILLLDEVEEWNLIANQYCFVIAHKN